MIESSVVRRLSGMGLWPAVQRAASEMGVSLDDVWSARRSASIVYVRRVVAAMLREHGWSLTEIGNFMGRDHTTIGALLGRRQRRLVRVA